MKKNESKLSPLKKLPFSVTIITFNEALKITDCLLSCDFVEDVLVVDSKSTDETVIIAKKLGARVIVRDWPGYGQQKNFAQQQAQFDWVLNIDADERVSLELKNKLFDIFQNQKIDQEPFLYYLPRKTFYGEQFIRYGGWYPGWVARLANRCYAHWTTPEIHEQLVLKKKEFDFKIGYLNADILHYSFDEIADQIQTNLKFAQLGGQSLLRKGDTFQLWRLLLKPWGKFLESYIFKRGFLDGFYGFVIACNAAHSMFLKYAFLKELEMKNKKKKGVKKIII